MSLPFYSLDVGTKITYPTPSCYSRLLVSILYLVLVLHLDFQGLAGAVCFCLDVLRPESSSWPGYEL
jgi:hypothetical protein